jgi:hypothetical protein
MLTGCTTQTEGVSKETPEDTWTDEIRGNLRNGKIRVLDSHFVIII